MTYRGDSARVLSNIVVIIIFLFTVQSEDHARGQVPLRRAVPGMNFNHTKRKGSWELYCTCKWDKRWCLVHVVHCLRQVYLVYVAARIRASLVRPIRQCAGQPPGVFLRSPGGGAPPPEMVTPPPEISAEKRVFDFVSQNNSGSHHSCSHFRSQHRKNRSKFVFCAFGASNVAIYSCVAGQKLRF